MIKAMIVLKLTRKQKSAIDKFFQENSRCPACGYISNIDEGSRGILAQPASKWNKKYEGYMRVGIWCSKCSGRIKTSLIGAETC